MKYLKLRANKDGSLTVLQNDLMFYIDNDAAELWVDFSSADVAGLRKWVDFVMADSSETSRPILSEFTTDDLLVVDLDNTITKRGPLQLQPYANNPLTSQRVNFEIYKTVVGNSLNVLSDSSFVDETALQAALNGKINLDGLNSNIDELHFNVSPASTDQLLEGQMRWNHTDRTIDVGVDGSGVVMQVGQETYYPEVRNVDTVEIEDGETVMYAGTVGGSGIIFIKKAYTPLMPLPGALMGIATEHIAVNGTGKITWFGLIRNVDTSGSVVGEVWTDNTVLYNHPTLAGKLSATKPVAPASAVQVATVVRAHATSGILFVRPLYFPRLEHLSNVAIATPAQGQLLSYDASDARWVNATKWDDLMFPLTQAKIGANLKPDYDYTNVGLLFPQNDTSEAIQITVQLPHRWKEGSTIFPHIHVVQTTNQQATFRMEYKWYNPGEAVPVGWSTYDMNTYSTTYTSGSLANMIGNNVGIAGTGKLISSILKIKLYRTDNVYTGDILADQFDIHVEIDSVGSESRTVK